MKTNGTRQAKHALSVESFMDASPEKGLSSRGDDITQKLGKPQYNGSFLAQLLTHNKHFSPNLTPLVFSQTLACQTLFDPLSSLASVPHIPLSSLASVPHILGCVLSTWVQKPKQTSSRFI